MKSVMKKIIAGSALVMISIVARADGLASGGPVSMIMTLGPNVLLSTPILVVQMAVNDGGNYLTDCGGFSGNLVADLTTEEGKLFFNVLQTAYGTQEDINIDYVVAPESDYIPESTGTYCKIISVYRGTLN